MMNLELIPIISGQLILDIGSKYSNREKTVLFCFPPPNKQHWGNYIALH